MDLILWRHAEAEEGGPDLERKLTSKGHKQAARMAEWLTQRLPSKFLVVSSPARRAVQTAEALAMPHRVAPRLAPGASPMDVLEAVDWPNRKGTVVVTGHQPTLGCTAAWLVGGNAFEWSLRKGALWWLSDRVRNEESQVVVRAVMSPEML